ncbi:MAG: LysR family positive regulator for ilvC [bacterium]|jgi:LysR family positive regulator for ilvC
MDYQTLKIFLHLSTTLHFGKTSEECYLSPSTLSRMIQRLEDSVGYKLFIRNNRKVSITKEGELFKEYAHKAIVSWDNFQNKIQNQSTNLKGEIKLFCSVTACYSVLPTILQNFRKLYPEIKVKIEIGNTFNAFEKIRTNSVDVSVAVLPEIIPENILIKKITSTPLVFFTSKEMSKEHLKKIDWTNTPVILPQTGIMKDYALRWFQQKNIDPIIYSQVVGNEAIPALVHLGCGIGVAPKMVIENSPLLNKLYFMDNLSKNLPTLDIAVCINQKKMDSPLTQVYWNSIA